MVKNMSNVFARNRKETTLETLNVARELSITTYKLIMNEKKIPKKHRYFIGKSLFNTTEKIIENIFRANNIFPRTKEDLLRRKAYQEKANQECSLFLNFLELYSSVLPELSYKDIEKLTNLAIRIKQMLTNWIKSDSKEFEKLTG